MARREKRKPRKLFESDFLLGIQDKLRIGALRYALQEGGPFLSGESGLMIPPWVTLRELASASLAFENDDNALSEKWLRLLLEPGSSLGGARAKATVQDSDGSLWIAKFPSKLDEYDVGAWEMTVHDLAGLCGLYVPEARLEKFSELGSIFLARRFDRNGGQRLHYASAMTMLDKTDGDDDTSYLDIAEILINHSSDPNKDLKELWKRIVFSILVSNTDDHLRNHGFLYDGKRWRLSPLFDVNPNPYGNDLSLAITLDDRTISLSLALETAMFYRIDTNEAQKTIEEMAKTVCGQWKVIAKRYGLNRKALDYMEPAFYAGIRL